MGYVFNKILGFEVHYRIFEKVNYIITFKYKGKIGQLGHYKLSYKLYLENEVKDEVLKKFQRVNELLELVLIEYSKEVMLDNKFSLPNYYHLYTHKIKMLIYQYLQEL